MISEKTSHATSFPFFMELPIELNELTLQSCDEKTVANCAASSKYLNEIILSESFWKHSFEKRGYQMLPENFGFFSYRNQYRVIRLLEKYCVELLKVQSSIFILCYDSYMKH